MTPDWRTQHPMDVPLDPSRRLVKAVPDTYVGLPSPITTELCRDAYKLYRSHVLTQRDARTAARKEHMRQMRWYRRAWRWVTRVWKHYLEIL